MNTLRSNNREDSDYRLHQRMSISSRVSRVFQRARFENVTASQSVRSSSACEVPIFLSTPHTQAYDEQNARSGLFGATMQETPMIGGDRSNTNPGSSVYSESLVQQCSPELAGQSDDSSLHSPTSADDLEAANTGSSHPSSELLVVKTRHRKRRKTRESTRQKIAGKRILSMAVGVTVLASVITYVILAATNVAQGLAFHIIAILFILALTGTFLHSFVSMIILQKRRRARSTRHRDWLGSVTERSTSVSDTLDSFADNSMTEKPLEIRMGAEEIITTTPRGRNKQVIKQPPPVYGSFRGSQRMDPELVYWHKQNPSPSTPTYEEAMKEAQTAVGYQPPLYSSPVNRKKAHDGERVCNIHPLERERVVGLMSNTMASRRD